MPSNVEKVRDKSFIEPAPSFYSLLKRYKKEASASNHWSSRPASHEQARRAHSEGEANHHHHRIDGGVTLFRTSRQQAKALLLEASSVSVTQSVASSGSNSESEPPPPLEASLRKSGAAVPPRHLRNVYQQPLQTMHHESFQPPTFSRTPSEIKQIRTALRRNFVFKDLLERDLDPLIQAFEKIEFQRHDVIIRQGDPGDYFYIIQQGEVVFRVNEEDVGTGADGSSFGELGLLYTVRWKGFQVKTHETCHSYLFCPHTVFENCLLGTVSSCRDSGSGLGYPGTVSRRSNHVSTHLAGADTKIGC